MASKYGGMIFIAAPREISAARFKQIVKHYLPKASIVLGVSKEPCVVGFEGQPQFRMLERAAVQPIIDKVNAASTDRQIYVLEYSQTELAEVVAVHRFSRVLLVNGSWKFTFQNHPAHQVLVGSNIPFKYISPFSSEKEAKNYEALHRYEFEAPDEGSRLTESDMLELVGEVAKKSYDYSFQTGAVLGRREGDFYQYLLAAFNKVVPYQTYALHHGNSRERHGSAVHDTAHYDTIHAEMFLLTEAIRKGVNLKDTTLFINLLPCPNCARVLSQTDISEVVYERDHSDGYAVRLLEASGKSVRHVKTAQGAV